MPGASAQSHDASGWGSSKMGTLSPWHLEQAPYLSHFWTRSIHFEAPFICRLYLRLRLLLPLWLLENDAALHQQLEALLSGRLHTGQIGSAVRLAQHLYLCPGQTE